MVGAEFRYVLLIYYELVYSNKRSQILNINMAHRHLDGYKALDSKEHVNHIVASCPILAPKEYTHRHNRIANCLHWSTLKEPGQNVPDRWYDHQPEKVVEFDNTALMYDMAINADRSGLQKYLDELPGKESVAQEQKMALLCTAHILHKFLTAGN
ncbi:hypothetical protein HELRODRAFT_163805 [Helobdella robusta]|uniref:Uncharacterized protein n=1 Tax=Helobdella robusta TaxID=6412 RepID=T1EUH7_HELRO|nr:hypothetical protein HELRODRAFT_163805 [Helobdella robusta]ESN96709.1 hypothetical protein HELRODRAFT_163805 [Helobdella robusta]